MTYTKPEINLLGDATRVIQFVFKTQPANIDPDPRTGLDPAYDLDE